MIKSLEREFTHYEEARAVDSLPVRPGDWLNNLSSAQRKDTPICTGVIDYFPDALAAVAQLSKFGNDKHNPGQPLHWNRSKSTDHADCIARHLANRGQRDGDGQRHSASLAWRALALLQLEIEAERAFEARHPLFECSGELAMHADHYETAVEVPLHIGDGSGVI